MPDIPRGITGAELADLLHCLGYVVTRQSGSHLRLTSMHMGTEHHVTIPDHNPIKIGTLNNILKDISGYLKIDKQTLIKTIFHKGKA
jgi:predicted RNA binding protein YcfA (HicA-like mRNA interferase family)